MDPVNLTRTWVLDEVSEALLRPIAASDLTVLREQKNRMRTSFFFQDEITPEMQQSWYQAFRMRDDDWMYVIDVAGVPSGCIGLRLDDGVVDFYNLMMWERSGSGLMSRALAVLIGAARKEYPAAEIGVVVLAANPAVDWYVRRGFHRQGVGQRQGRDYVMLRYGGLESTGSADD